MIIGSPLALRMACSAMPAKLSSVIIPQLLLWETARNIFIYNVCILCIYIYTRTWNFLRIFGAGTVELNFKKHRRHLQANPTRSQPPPPLASDEPSPKHAGQFRDLARLELSKCTRSLAMRCTREMGQLEGSAAASSQAWSRYDMSFTKQCR